MNYDVSVRPDFLEFAHDLRSPLTAIRTCAEIMVRHPEADYLRQVIANVDRAEKLIAEFLEVSSQLPSRPVLLSELVRGILAEIGVGHENRFSVEITESAFGVRVAEEIRRAIVNLVENALKYSRRESPIRIRIDREQDFVLLSIHNFHESQAQLGEALVFTPFYRGPDSVGCGIQGWGIGLSIVQKIVQKYGGSVGLDGLTPGEARFTIRLPIRSEFSAPSP